MNVDFTQIFNLKTNNLRPDKGRVLISEPFAVDEIFKRSVVLLTSHSDEGSMGFILNKIIPQRDIAPKLLEKVGGKPVSIGIGGPVEMDRLFFIYSAQKKLFTESEEIINGVYIGGDFDKLTELIVNNQIDIDNVRFFLGYSGWAPMQLDSEIKRNFWLVKNVKKDEIFSKDKNLWANQIKQLEKEYKIWTMIPEDPSVN